MADKTNFTENKNKQLMNDNVLYFNNHAYQVIRETKEGLMHFQALLDAFNSLGLPFFNIQNIEQLCKLAESGEKYCRLRIADGMEQPMISGITIKKELIIDNMGLPDFTTLNDFASDCRPFMHCAQYYSLHNDSIGLIEDAEEAIKLSFSRIADTKEKKEVLTAYANAANAVNNLNKLLLKHTNTSIIGEQPMHTAFFFDNQTIKPNDHFFEATSFNTDKY